jgi:hypothetical protein
MRDEFGYGIMFQLMALGAGAVLVMAIALAYITGAAH